ncbi:MAG: hypothetical protein ACI8RD_004435 [Bacillariaceae sp.]|jgi:hypothetical protein
MTDIPQLPEIISPSAVDNISSQDVSSRRSRQATADILANNSTEIVSTSRRSSFLEQDEGVLMEVLEELDRERHKRAELEARVRVLEQEVHIQRRKNSKSSKTSVRDYTLVKTERDGYKEILDAITQDRPAFSTGSSNSSRQNQNSHQSLPIHIVRLLEVMPWDSRAQQYIFGEEQVYEWQIYSADKRWQKDQSHWIKELRYFPTFFKTLPIVVPTPGRIVSDEVAKGHPYFGPTVTPPKQCVLTNLEGTTIFNIDKGYPLPEDGSIWTWVGPWKVEKNNDTDEKGWAYSNGIEIMSDLSYHGELRLPGKGTANVTKRRRKWIRLRTLIDYPHASNMTREYLKLIAERSRLDVNVGKLSGQLVDTKMSLTTLEADKERTDVRIRELERDLDDKNKILGLVEHGAGLDLTTKGVSTHSSSDVSSKSTDSTKKVDQVTDLRSTVSQWVSKLQSTNEEETSVSNSSLSKVYDDVHKGNGNETDGDSTTSNTTEKTEQSQQQEPKQQLFDSLRDKGTGFFEILKQKGEQLDKIKQGGGGDSGGGGLPWNRKDEDTNKDNDECDSSASTTKSNVYVPSPRVRFSSSGSSIE